MTERKSPGSPGSLEGMVEATDLPFAVVALPSAEILAANDAMARLTGAMTGALIGSNYLDWLVPAQRHAAEAMLRALAEGWLTGYQAVRHFELDLTHEFTVWVWAVDAEGGRVGLAAAARVRDGSARSNRAGAVRDVLAAGDVVLGTLDHEWRVDRVSNDVVEVLGSQPEELVGCPVLGAIYPGDAPSFLGAVEHSRVSRRTVRLTVRLRAKPGGWVPVTLSLATLTDDFPPVLAFALSLSDEATAGGAEGSRFGEELERVARDVRIARMVPRLGHLTELSSFEALSSLTAREWAVLTAMLEGQRVDEIASELYLSRSTVRNHLSSIFSKLGVHSQIELVRKLHSA
jgi:DNA-binding CsgD family transcriptional regulator/PAS domain-containing protein